MANNEIVQALHLRAEKEMKASSGWISDAWLYVYEKTADFTKSVGWVETQLFIAINDPRIPATRKKVYQQVVDSFQEPEENTHAL